MASSTSGRGSGSSTNANQKKKKLVIFSGSAVLLLCMVVGVAVGVSRHNSSKGSSSDGGGGGLTTTSKAVKSICQPTDFKELCESSLSKAAGNATDPKSLVEASFNVTIDHIREAFLHSSILQRAAKDPRTSEALDDCKSLLDYAIDELKASFAKLEGLDISKIDDIIDDLKVWLSAAVTYQETCLDGFENVTGDAAVSMRKALNSSQALTSNSLAIVDEISAVLSTFDIPLVSRRLLSEEQEEEEDGGEFPSWVANGKRRLLALATNEMKADVVVAQDGSGNYKTIKEALAAIPKRSNSTFVIHIKTGVYKEQVLLDKSMVNVMMVGDGPTKTRITGNLNFVDGTTTFKTATFGKQ